AGRGGARGPAEIGALARALAGDEEADLRLLCLAGAAAERQEQRRRHAYRQSNSHVHSGLLVMSLRPAMSPLLSGPRARHVAAPARRASRRPARLASRSRLISVNATCASLTSAGTWSRISDSHPWN